MENENNNKKSPLSFFSLSDEYERKARFFPAILTIIFFLPAAFALGVPLIDWLTIVLTGVGISSIIAIGLSHLASAFGNRFQKILWPNWPYDSPTNMRLHPSNSIISIQQKQQWYAIIYKLTSLNVSSIPIENNDEIETTINDAVTQIRTRVWKLPIADRLRLHNIDYGFARNLAGFRIVWLSGSTIVSIICWVAFFKMKANLNWCIISSLIAIIAYPLAFFILPDYVRIKANHYADSFFDVLKSLYREEIEKK